MKNTCAGTIRLILHEEYSIVHYQMINTARGVQYCAPPDAGLVCRPLQSKCHSSHIVLTNIIDICNAFRWY
jgi:hypothetical protein